ncbi:unnamed protein product [Bursaphelenchus xylophilus]|uniref:(pine wood nematode) hypothetical protein n=1 Tax=Bursaphelenchus xylophilus TaxID=6326 RepID=A0A7I8WIC1_BURXY|nr:unnamed protein product [Bursaphelenchus xylophilus]CAG9108968.1 unnamed protein product [Bursaphelenchus xylophilus]
MYALEKITSFFSSRKRKTKSFPSLVAKKQRQSTESSAEFTKPPVSSFGILQLPRETLWHIFEHMDLTSLIRFQQVSSQSKYDVIRFLKRTSQIPKFAKWFSEFRSNVETSKMCQFMMKAVFMDEFSIFHYQSALNWLKAAYPFRDVLPLPMMLETFMFGISTEYRILLIRGLTEAFFKEDMSSYIKIRLEDSTRYTELESEMYLRFRETMYNVQMENNTKALVFSTFLRYFASLWTARVEYICVMALFGPRKVSGEKMAINFEEIEDGHLAPTELRGISEFFRILPSLESTDVPRIIRWSKRACFALLEDLTTSPMWSMQNFVTLLILQPYLALITITVRVDSGMIAEAASVFFYILRWLYPSNNKIRFAEYILNHISADEAREFFIHFRQQSVDYLNEYRRIQRDEQVETIREAVVQAYFTVFGFDPEKDH